MRILHVIPSFAPAWCYGGAIEAVYQLCRYLARGGHEVRVLTTDADGSCNVLSIDTDREIEMSPGLRVRYCHRLVPQSISLHLLCSLPSYLRWADVVHLTAVYSFPTLPTLMGCKVLDKPAVWSPRGALQRWSGSTHPTLKTIWERCCQPVAPKRLVLHLTSDAERRESLERFPASETIVIPEGVEIPDEVTYASADGALRLAFLGRLDPKKGIENLFHACRMLNDSSGLNWSLIIAGAGEPRYTEALKALRDDLALSQQVIMAGEVIREAKQRFFENADILVVPSYTENFGMVVAEALAHGVPVIASKGTPWEQLEEVGCGLWVENDPKSLAEAITRMSQMQLLDMGRRGREWMAKEFSWQQVAEKMIQVYQNLSVRSS